MFRFLRRVCDFLDLSVHRIPCLTNRFGDFNFEKPLSSVGVVSCLLLLTMTMLNDEGGGGVAMLMRAARPGSATQTHSFCFIIF